MRRLGVGRKTPLVEYLAQRDVGWYVIPSAVAASS